MLWFPLGVSQDLAPRFPSLGFHFHRGVGEQPPYKRQPSSRLHPVVPIGNLLYRTVRRVTQPLLFLPFPIPYRTAPGWGRPPVLPDDFAAEPSRADVALSVPARRRGNPVERWYRPSLNDTVLASGTVARKFLIRRMRESTPRTPWAQSRFFKERLGVDTFFPDHFLDTVLVSLPRVPLSRRYRATAEPARPPAGSLRKLSLSLRLETHSRSPSFRPQSANGVSPSRRPRETAMHAMPRERRLHRRRQEL